MIPIQDKEITKSGNLNGEKIAMTIDENSLDHLQTILSDLYSDLELAIIRELSTNGRDAQVEIGNNSPIHISLPSALNPQFVVQDYGVGMSVDDIRNIYSRYGASTKRGTNDQTGLLGLGAKAPLAYGNGSFTVEAVKNGVKTVAFVSKNENGRGEIDIADTVSTNEPNGVKITINVSNWTSFNDKAQKFFQYWKPGTVLVDGKEPEFVINKEGTIKVNENTFVVKADDYSPKPVVVMGNVPYRVSIPGDYDTLLLKGGYSYRSSSYIVSFVPIGTVAFTPSREDLTYSTRTINELKRINTEFYSNVYSVAEKNITAAVGEFDKARAYSQWQQVLDMRKVKVSFIDPLSLWHYSWTINGNVRYDLNQHTSVLKTMLFEEEKTIVVTDYDISRPSKIVRDKLDSWIASKGKEYNKAVFIKSDTAPHELSVISGFDSVSYKDLRKIRFGTTKSGVTTAGPKDHYEYIDKTGRHRGKSTNNLANKKIFYISPSDLFRDNQHWVNLYNTVARLYKKDFIILVISKNRHEKFNKQYKKAVHVQKFIKGKLMAVAKSWSKTDALSWAANHSGDYDNVFRQIGSRIGEIEDPAFANVKEAIGREWTKSKSYEKVDLMAQFSTTCQDNQYGYGRNNAESLVTNLCGKWIDVADEFNLYETYPLIRATGRYDPYSTWDVTVVDHTIKYINAIHNEKEGV